MRLRQRRSPLFLLLIPSLAATAVFASSSNYDTADTKAAAAAANSVPAAAAGAAAAVESSPAKVKYDVGTKDAPVDGKDGRPHSGPFVEVENLRKEKDEKERPPLKDKPKDVHIIDGKIIPESNDGVMDDKNRPEPKEGTTGTSGGVSEKDKARKQKETNTGEKAQNKPETPKEAPPLPHSEQEKIISGQDKKEKQKIKEKEKEQTKESSKEKGSKDAPGVVTGLEKPNGLPEKTHEGGPPVPNSANKDHLDVTKQSSKSSTSKTGLDDDEDTGVIRPFHSFILSLTMILFSEVGDKTFLVAALMAMKHDRMVVFSAAFSALITMTFLSAILGHALPSLLPKRVTSFLAAALFLVFGARMLREGLAMSRDEGVSAEMQEVELELAEKENLARQQGRRRSSISPYALEMGLDRKSRSKSRFPTPPRSPSTSPGRSPSPRGGALGGFLAGLHNLSSLLLSPAWVQTFVMTFLGEWGDRSQIATIAMAAGQDYWWVTLGAVLGHGCCTGVAVIGGRAIAGRVSLKVVTVGGAVAFLLFGVIYFVEAFYSA